MRRRLGIALVLGAWVATTGVGAANLVFNPGFEQGELGWEGEFWRVTRSGYVGTFAAVAEGYLDGPSGLQQWGVIAQTVPVVAESTYTTHWFYRKGPNGLALVQLWFRDAAGDLVGNVPQFYLDG